jgi:hypothetical protein
MARCEDKNLRSASWGRKRFFHRWQEWSKPFQATYRGVVTLVQTRDCLYCKKTKVRAL